MLWITPETLILQHFSKEIVLDLFHKYEYNCYDVFRMRVDTIMFLAVKQTS